MEREEGGGMEREEGRVKRAREGAKEGDFFQFCPVFSSDDKAVLTMREGGRKGVLCYA